MITTHALIFAAASAAGSSSDWITKVFMGMAGLVGAFTAYRVAKRDSNADALKEAVQSLANANRRIGDLEEDMVDMRKWQHNAQMAAAGKGLDLPEPPVLRSERAS